MRKDHIVSMLTRHTGYELTPSQGVAANALADFFSSTLTHQCFLLKGYAGTGKTTLIASAVRVLLASRVKVVLLAPTGRAAKVLSAYSGYPAFTIHKWIYEQKSLADGGSQFGLSSNILRNALFIVDEASMLSNQGSSDSVFGSGRLLDDLIEYVYSGEGCSLMLVGDDAQLPPIGLDISPALEGNRLRGFGLNVLEVTLREVVRQAQGSGILHNATTLRSMLEEKRIEIPSFALEGFPDIVRVSGAELLEAIETCYGKRGREETVILNYSNRRANRYNQGIRNQVLWHEEELSPGDLLMVVRNNYYWAKALEEIPFIANGDTLEVLRILRVAELYGFRFADVTVRFIDYQEQELEVKVLLDTLAVDGPSLPDNQYKTLYERVAEDYADVANRKTRSRRIRQDPYLNALQVKFAYAVTCHKAQGGQWKNVLIDQGYFTKEMMSREYLRWLYTAFTRATEKLYLINFSDDFFGKRK